MIDIAINNQVLLVIAAFVAVVLLGNVLYIFLKDRRNDKEEIKEILESKSDGMDDSNDSDQKKSEIEEMLEKMQQDLEAKSEDVVENFEKEQEEKSIISYQELLKTLNKETEIEPKNHPEVIKVEDVKESTSTDDAMLEEHLFHVPTIHTLEELEEPYKVEETSNMTKDTTQAIKKFKNTEFISPVYGKMEGKLEYPTVPSFQETKQESKAVEDILEEFDRKIEQHNIDNYLEDFELPNHMKIDSLEQTLDMPPISPEVKVNEEFLQALKEFRKNLE